MLLMLIRKIIEYTIILDYKNIKIFFLGIFIIIYLFIYLFIYLLLFAFKSLSVDYRNVRKRTFGHVRPAKD